MLQEFIMYLVEQIKEPYLWGGQHTKLTPENYKSVIAKKESQEKNRELVEQYCQRMFAEGYTVLYAYDCSGLGCYWLYNLEHLYKCDVNANTMMSRCELRSELPKKGWWVFRLDGKRAVHIGYMVDDQYLVEAKGRKYGVVKTKFRASDWDRWGVPNVFKDEIDHPEPNPDPIPEKTKMIKVKGSVRVREGNGKNFDPIPPTPKNCLLEYRGQAKEAPYWYETIWQGQYGFISSDPKYTEIVEIN